MVARKRKVKQSDFKGFPKTKKGDRVLVVDIGDDLEVIPLKKRKKKMKGGLI